MARVSSTHHVFSIEHLLCELWHCESTVLLGASGCERREADHEEVKTREGNKIHSKLAEICIQLTRETKARCHTTHGCADEMVKITVSWRGQLKGPEANIVQGFIVEQHAFISILHQLME